MNRLFRRQFIVDSKFQWAVIGYTFAISLFTSMAQVTISRLRILEESMAQLQLGFAQIDPKMAMWFLLVFCYVGLFVVSVLFSSRLAGPLFRLRKHMVDVRNGREIKEIHFRKGDYYSDLSETYNSLLSSISLKRGDNEKGFSLIELSVVLVIMSVLALISFGSFMSAPNDTAKFNQEVVILRDALVSARNVAVAKNQCAVVTVVGPTEVRIRTYIMPGSCTGVLPAPDSEIVRNFGPHTTVSSFNVGTSLVFRPSGGTTLSSPANLSLSDSTGRVRKINIYPAIGQVRLM